MRREDLLQQADMWSVILNYEVSLQDVYLCMIAVKMSRLIHDSEHEDSWVDIAGYAALGGEVAIPPLKEDITEV